MLKKNLLFLTLVALSGCNYKVNKVTPDDGITGLSAGQLTYQAVNTSVLAKNCVSCHSQAGGNKGGVNLETYAEVKRNSKQIREQVADKSMPPRTQLSDAQINMIITWIDAGATEDGQPQSIPTEPSQPTTPPTTPPPAPTPKPDPVFTLPDDPKQISYEMVRVNLLVPKCIKCHSEPNNKGDVNLETYENVISHLGEIYSDIEDGSMPKGKDNKLTDDQKQLFFRWKDAGAPKEASAPAPTPTPAPTNPLPAPVPQPGTPPVVPPTPAPADPVFTIPADPKDITFEMIRVNVLVPKCLKCHSAPANKGDVNLETYDSVMQNITEAYDDIMDGSMPKGKNPMTDNQKQLFFRWHDAGAKEKGAAG